MKVLVWQTQISRNNRGLSTSPSVHCSLFSRLRKFFFPLLPTPEYAAGTQNHITSSKEPLAHLESAQLLTILLGLEKLPVKQKTTLGFLLGFLTLMRNLASLWLAAPQCDRAGKQETPGTWRGVGDSTGPWWNASFHPKMKKSKLRQCYPTLAKQMPTLNFHSLHVKGSHSFITGFNRAKFLKYIFIKHFKLLLSSFRHFITRRNYSRAV